MSEARVIACNNCGSRYKLPPTFQGSKVRCKNCSAVIEIESSIVAPAAPATAKPKSRPAKPTKKPVAAEPTASASSRRKGSKVSGSRSRRGRRDAVEEEEEEVEEKTSRRGARGGSRASSRRSAGSKRVRRGADGEIEEKSKTPMMLGIGGGVLVLAVALFFILGGKGDQKPADVGQGNEVAKTDSGSAKDATKDSSELPPEEDSGSKVAKGGDEKSTDGTPKEAGAKGEGKAEEAAAKKEPKKTTKKDPKKKRVPQESSTPFDPMTETEELVWAEDVTDEEKKEITQQVEDAFSDDSIFGMRAGRKLEANSRKAFSAIVNRLRSVDYSDQDQHLQAYGLHKLLEKITMGRNVGYNPKVPVTQGAAWWNARTVKGWMRFWNDQVNEGDVAAWKEFMRKRTSKQTDDNEDF